MKKFIFIILILGFLSCTQTKNKIAVKSDNSNAKSDKIILINSDVFSMKQ